jgi:hypothetical protein
VRFRFTPPLRLFHYAPREYSLNKIFICYRSADEPNAAAMVDQILTAHFGADAVFRAARSIGIGEDFDEEIIEAVRTSSVFLVVIGPRWLEARGADGRGLRDPDDMVRREIATAFEHGVRVVPVLLTNAPRLKSEDLPKKLRKLARCQDVRVNFRNIEYDGPALVERVRRALEADGHAVAEPVTRSVLMVDVENMRTAGDLDVVERRRVVNALVRKAFAGTRIAPASVVVENRGDLVVTVVDAELLTVLDTAVENLITLLGRHNRTREARDWLRLRIAAHRGLVHHDEHGWSGAELAETSDLLVAAQVRTVLERAQRAQCAVVVPGSVYRELIAHGHDNLNAQAYAELTNVDGWVRVPGYPLPPIDDTPPAAAAETRRPSSVPLPNHIGNMFVQNKIEKVDAPVHYGVPE